MPWPWYNVPETIQLYRTMWLAVIGSSDSLLRSEYSLGLHEHLIRHEDV